MRIINYYLLLMDSFVQRTEEQYRIYSKRTIVLLKEIIIKFNILYDQFCKIVHYVEIEKVRMVWSNVSSIAPLTERNRT